MPAGDYRQAVGEVRRRKHRRSRDICGAGRCERIGSSRCDCQKATVQMRDHDLSSARHHETHSKRSILATTFRRKHHAIRECLAQTTSRAASSSSKSAVEQRLAIKGYRDAGSIPSRSISPADEGHRLPRQDRETPGCACDDAQLEYD